MYIAILATVIIIYLYLIMPRILGKKDFSPFLGRLYAHRGYYDNSTFAPENSLEAFKLAVSKDFGVELDVQLTKDDKLVVFHDKSLLRATGLDKEVNELDYEDLKALKLFSSKETIPLFSEVLEVINYKIPIIVELKSVNKDKDSKIGPIVCEHLDNYQGLFMVESFNPFLVAWFKLNRDNWIRGQLSFNYRDSKSTGKILGFGLTNLMLNFMAKPDFIAYRFEDRSNLSLKLLKYLYKAKLVSYTIKNKKELEASQKFFDITIFEGFEP